MFVYVGFSCSCTGIPNCDEMDNSTCKCTKCSGCYSLNSATGLCDNICNDNDVSMNTCNVWKTTTYGAMFLGN